MSNLTPGLMTNSISAVQAAFDSGSAVEKSTFQAAVSYAGKNNIAIIGDSRARVGYRDWFKGATIANLFGISLDVLGAGVGITTATSGTLEYRSADKYFRWTTTGNSPGAWVPVAMGRMSIADSNPACTIEIIVKSIATLPATDQTLSATILGTMYQQVGWDGIGYGCMTQVVSALKNGPKFYRLGAAGAFTSEILEMMPYYNEKASGPGIDIYRASTNDITSNAGITLNQIVANMTAVFMGRINAGRRLVICSEPARWGVDTATPLTSQKLAILIGVNKFYRSFCEERPEIAKYVDLYSISVDPGYTDGRPLSGMLIDTVHDGGAGATAFGNAIAAAVIELGAVPAPPPMRGDTDVLLTAGWLTGTGGTAGTGITGVVPAGISITRNSGSTAITAVSSVVDYVGRSGKYLSLAISGSPTAEEQINVTVPDKTLAQLGLVVGDKVKLDMDLETTTQSGLVFVNFFLFIYGGTTVRSEIQFPPRVAGELHGSSTEITLPAGTTNVGVVGYINVATGGSANIKFGEIMVRKVS